ncbi:MAG: TetR/AcrR family transcriptional regulator [Spirochaetes bacterium]|jgi:AcrR family transcriptional regulator|nr:TetR/AcrR family transcriptional regulator [Spirochaetota bacterium]
MKDMAQKNGDRGVRAPAEIPGRLKDRLYPVVLDLFSKNDFYQVNLREISRESGLSTSTIYRYFSSKEELLFTILNEKLSEIRELVRVHIQGLDSTREILRKILWVTMDFYDRNPGVAITSFITVPMRTWMREESFIRADERRVLVDIVTAARKRRDIDLSLEVREIFDVYYMICYRAIYTWYYHGMRWKLVDTIPGYFDRIWRMLAPPEGQNRGRGGKRPRG